LSFVLNQPLTEVAAKLETQESLRRLLASQGIELTSRRVTNRKFSFDTQSLSATVALGGLAPAISHEELQIEGRFQLAPQAARIVLVLLKPAGQLAAQQYTIDAVDQAGKTAVNLRIDTRAMLPQKRLRMVQRLVNRVGERVVVETIDQAICDLAAEMQSVAAQPRPADAKSIFAP
jgi:hypothetical protein